MLRLLRMRWAGGGVRVGVAQGLVEEAQDVLARAPEERRGREAARAHALERGRDERAREQVRGQVAEARRGAGPERRRADRHRRSCRGERGWRGGGDLAHGGAAPEDAGDAGVHPQDVHGQRAREHDRGRPAPAGGGRADGVLRAEVDVQNDAGEEEDYCEDLRGASALHSRRGRTGRRT